VEVNGVDCLIPPSGISFGIFLVVSDNISCFLIAVAAHLTGIHSAIKMLHSRIKVLHHYLVAMQKGMRVSSLQK